MPAATPGIKRGCGTREQGGIYLETGTSAWGEPLEAFLADPPIPMTCDSKVGVELTERHGVVHVLDWVGQEHYPYVADVLEEGRHYGFSRRIPKTLDLSRLTRESRLMLVHAGGLVVNHQSLRPHVPSDYQDPYQSERLKPPHEHHCGLLARTGEPLHYEQEVRCSRDLWTLPPASTVMARRANDRPRPLTDDAPLKEGESPVYVRQFASVAYQVHPLSPEAPPAEVTSALVAVLPITNITVIKAANDDHRETLENVKRMLAWEGGYRIAVGESAT